MKYKTRKPKNRIRRAREALGIHQGDLAKLMGTTQGAVSQWELGLTRPDTGKLKRLANILNVPIEDLIEDDEKVG